MSWGAIGGAAASAVVGSALGGGKSSGGGSATQQAWANPFTTSGGLFNTSWGQPMPGAPAPIAPTGGGVPNYNAGTQMGVSDGQIDENPYGFLPYVPNSTSATSGPQGPLGNNLNMGFNNPMLQGISDQGLFGANQFFNQAINNPTADMAGQLGQDFLGQLGGTSAMDVAQQQFNLMNPLMQQQQEQDFLNMEQRLFSQGRLGGGGDFGGSSQLQGLFDSQQDAERKLLYDSLGQGMQFQNHLFNLGSGLSQLDPSLRGSFQNLGSGMLNVPLSLQNAMLNQAGVVGGLAGSSQSGSTAPSQLGITETIGAGLINSGVKGLTNAASDWLQPDTAPVDNSFSGWDIA